MRRLLLIFAVATTTLLTGCIHESHGPGTGVIDLDALARQMGRRDAMNQTLKESSEELTRQLQASAALIQQKVKESVENLRANPTQAAQAAHQKLVADARRKIEEQKSTLTRKAQEKRKQLVVEFRNEIRPSVQKVAMARGVKIVLTATENLMWAEQSVDLTAAVLAELGGVKSE